MNRSMRDVPPSRIKHIADSSGRGWSRIFAEVREDSAGYVRPHHAHGIEIHLHTGPPVVVSWQQDGHTGRSHTPPGRTVVLRDRPYSHRYWSDTARYVRIVLDKTAVVTDAALSASVAIGYWPAPGDPFSGLGKLLQDELIKPVFHGDLLAEVITGTILRHTGTEKAEPDHGLSTSRIEAVIEYLTTCMDRPILVAELAAHVGMSQSQFSRALRHSTGHSPYHLSRNLRIERAKLLLGTSSNPGASIAAATGFFDEAHFSKAFKRVVGVTPRQWRARSMK